MNYCGSKDRCEKIVGAINDFIQDNNSDLFLDCCAGGLNVTKCIECNNIIINDTDYSLTLFYHRLYATDLPISDISKERYEKLKSEKLNKDIMTWEHGYACTQASFRNMRWAGYASDDKRRQNLNKIEKTRAMIKRRNIIAIWNNDITQFNMEHLGRVVDKYNNPVFYFDPPYYDTAHIYRKNVTKEGYFDYMRMIDVIRDIADCGWKVLLSERITRSDLIMLLGRTYCVKIICEEDINANLKKNGILETEYLYEIVSDKYGGYEC